MSRQEDFDAVRRLIVDPWDAFSVHLALTVGSHTSLGHDKLIGALADYLCQYITKVVDQPADAEVVMGKLAEYMVERVAGRIDTTARPNLDIVN